MQFNVPQFIESEAKIAGPLTFKQVLYLTGAGLIIMFLYFSLAKINFLAFIIITVFLVGFSLAFAFLKIHGYSFSVLLKNFFGYFVSSKIYLWERKVAPPKIVQKKEKPKKEVAEEPTLKIVEKSHLRKLSSQIETMTK